MRILTPAVTNKPVGGYKDQHVWLADILILGNSARIGAILDLIWDRCDIKKG